MHPETDNKAIVMVIPLYVAVITTDKIFLMVYYDRKSLNCTVFVVFVSFDVYASVA